MEAEEAREIKEKREAREEKSPPPVTVSLTMAGLAGKQKH